MAAIFAVGPCRGQTGAPPIPATEDPCALSAVLAVSYPSLSMECGDAVELSLVSDEKPPSTVAYQGANPNLNYTLMMVDPDAPSASNPWRAYVIHWLITNIGGDELRVGQYANGTEVMGYISPGPLEGTGFHRYQFFTFSQPGPLAVIPPGSRLDFDVAAFQSDHGLDEPMAGYQFRTQRADGSGGAAILGTDRCVMAMLAVYAVLQLF
ncbi:protein D2-like [Acanthaster planci]|uniref:Protein D2-like n=1 Tax=Acanthaster planci TaxID=133434 RepID=A0A8B7XZA2_ACAPL|nr:protein D2-like [Acanthaster planci]